ncbi:NAD-dependent DNA ligase [Pseudomonas phage 201phi2-1]|uniref:Putative DNA ligase n=1 Tax=Pseudomonas phage 201phi2-1 TaxID=198110 RepID=B3FJJ2_BP201|nr:NAD-dependent DNA ligase [Pseudomonas phage 201phi2-1]ABY63157.1 putative DNA ligase [Pseudomonas phage 201phi2-1]
MSLGINIQAVKDIQRFRDTIHFNELARDIFKNDGFDEIAYNDARAALVRVSAAYPRESKITTKARSIADQIKAFGSMARHDFPVLDYKPATTLMHVRNWLAKVDCDYTDNIDIIMTPYYNGCRVELVYQGGSLHKAITKGGGIMGTDFTMNAYLVEGIPQQILDNERISIRGVITSTLNHVWGEDEKRVISASLMSTEPTNINLNYLVFVPDDWHVPGAMLNTKDLRSISLAWDMEPAGMDSFPGQYKEIGYLEEKIETFRKEIKSKIPYSGILFTVDSLGRKMELGYTSIHPEWAILLEEKSNVKSP